MKIPPTKLFFNRGSNKVTIYISDIYHSNDSIKFALHNLHYLNMFNSILHYKNNVVSRLQPKHSSRVSNDLRAKILAFVEYSPDLFWNELIRFAQTKHLNELVISLELD